MAHEDTFAKDLAEIKREVEEVEALVVQLRHALDRAIERQVARQKAGGLSESRQHL